MIKLICALVLVACVASVQFKRQAEDLGKKVKGQWTKIQAVLEEAGVDVEAVQQKMDEYWNDPERKAQIKALIKENVPEGADAGPLIAELDAIDQGEGTHEEKFIQVVEAIKKATDGDARQVEFNKLIKFTRNPEHLQKYFEVVKELLPPEAEVKEVLKKIAKALGLPSPPGQGPPPPPGGGPPPGK